MNTNTMNKRIHCHVPYPQLSTYLDYVITHDINPEVFFSAETLDHLIWEELAAQSQTLHAAGLATTIHAPFLDLNPGALDPTIRKATHRRFQQVFQAAELLQPRVIVFHPGFDELRYGDNRMAWLKNSISFWRGTSPARQRTGLHYCRGKYLREGTLHLARIAGSYRRPQLSALFRRGTLEHVHHRQHGEVVRRAWAVHRRMPHPRQSTATPMSTCRWVRGRSISTRCLSCSSSTPLTQSGQSKPTAKSAWSGL